MISYPGVPGSNSTAVNSLFLCHFFFSQSEDSKTFQSLSHQRRWSPHMRASEVYKILPAELLEFFPRAVQRQCRPKFSISGSNLGLRCVFSSDPAVSSSIFVGAEREENLIGMIPTRASLQPHYCSLRG